MTSRPRAMGQVTAGSRTSRPARDRRSVRATGNLLGRRNRLGKADGVVIVRGRAGRLFAARATGGGRDMRTAGRLVTSVVMAGMVVGLALGAIGVGVRLGHPDPAGAANGDRFEEYVMCTGACAVSPRAPTDGVWVLDYRAGKLLGTVIDRTSGKIVGFAEVDLANEFKVQPKSNVHF